eukprot:TRINITY_DN22360_c0_g1_i2.p1 TRINITY_DN22360_c0_g1~~TRINITY_DN22360_c0_g1_i2.p1  ORF type:complete len:266 (+),score=44.17 TRINITY_DN22360_c0_g1_i2:108-905(+)
MVHALHDMDDYRRDGVVHVPGAFNSAWISYMQSAFDSAMASPSEYAEISRSQVSWWNAFSDNASLSMFMDFIFFEEAEKRVPAWAHVVKFSPAASLIASLMGSATAAFFYGQLIRKRSGAESIPWHQDLAYWKVDGRQLGTVWVALDDIPADAGVQYVRGSHRHSAKVQHALDDSSIDSKDLLSFDMEAGDALCFDARIVHGSWRTPKNQACDHRRVALRFAGDDAVYCDRPGHTPIPTEKVEKRHGLQPGDSIACAAFPKVYPM